MSSASVHSWRPARLLVVGVLSFGLAGCFHRSGPRILSADRFDYSAALTRSWKEQTLLNLVKLRYMDPPYFLNVQQVVQQYTLERSGSITSPGWPNNPSSIPAGSINGRWADSPTITYSPMSLEQFTTSLIRPVPPTQLLSLIQSAWPVDRVLAVVVKSINGLHAGSRVELIKHAGDPDFYRVLSLLRELQSTDSFGIRLETSKSGETAVMFFRSKSSDEATAEKVRKFRQLLHLSIDVDEFKIVLGNVQHDDKEIAMETRPMLQVLAEMSAGVEIPASDIDQGRVYKMDVSEIGPPVLVRVHSSTSKPEFTDAFAAVRYRNCWFWVDDRDMPSKSGFGFLMAFLAFAGSETTAQPPVLSISKP